MSMKRQIQRRIEENMFGLYEAKSEYEKYKHLIQNGITQRDVDTAYKNGYEEGYLFASECFLKKMYAAIAKELLEAGNDREEVVSFVKGTDHRFAVMFDADEEIEDVYDQIGVRFNVDRNAIERIEVTRV